VTAASDTNAASGALPAGFGGGTPDMWDEVHAGNEGQAADGLYPLRSAVERDILDAVLSTCHLGPGVTITELGVGSSRYLPHLATRTGARVAGVDFSRLGLDHVRRALALVGAPSDQIVEGDIADYARERAGEFDAVMSVGLVEHFDDLDEVVSWHFACARPGGRVLIVAPNLDSVNLAWARRTAPGLFSWHRPVSARQIAEVAGSVGGRDVSVSWIGGPRLFAYPEPDLRSARQHRSALATRKAFNGLGEALHRLSPAAARALAARRLSPFFAVAATRADP
jgi:SAM-dependent methyltransferase